MKLDINVFGYIIMGFVLFMCLKVYQESDTFNLKCIVSTVDGNKYCVRERNKIQLVADLLARVTNKLKILVPTNMLDEYNFQSNPPKFVHKNIKKEIVKGDKINIILTDIRYNKQNYNCIGKIDE